MTEVSSDRSAPASAGHTAALAAFCGKTPSGALKAGDGAVGWMLPYLVSLMLNSPYFAVR